MNNGYLIYNDVELKKRKKKNKTMIFLGYSLFFVVIGIVFYVYIADKNNINHNTLMLKENNNQENILSEMVIDEESENYTIEDNETDNNTIDNNNSNISKTNKVSNSKSNISSDKKVNSSNTNNTAIVEIEKIKEIDSIKLDSVVSLKKGSSINLIPIISPSDAKDKTLKWSSNNSNVIVSQNGKIYGNNVGEAIVSVMTNNGKSANCVVKVEVNKIEVSKIELNITKKDMIVGSKAQLIATISPSNATERNITFISSNSNVVDVDNQGYITAKSVGLATITVKSSNGKTALCTINVKPIEVSSIELNSGKIILEENETYELKALITPTNATSKNITWESSNAKVASVDEKGNVKAISLGTAIITAKTINGKTASCNVQVIGLTYKFILNNQLATTNGTENVWYQFSNSKIINNQMCYYYTDSNLSNCLNKDTIVKPSKTGYTFFGYYTEPNGKGEKYINENGVIINDAYKNLNKDTTLYANWIINNYTISFDVNNGTNWTTTTCPSNYTLVNGLCNKTISYNSTYQSFPTPIKEGYKFDGWYTLSEGGEKITNLIVKDDITLYAHWIVEQPTVNFVYYSQMSYSSVKFCGQNKTIANAGCGVTSAAMVATSLTGNRAYTPVYMMNLAYKAKYCGGSKSGTDPSFFRYFASALGLKFKQVSKSSQTTVLNYLKSGNSLVIAHMGKGTFTDNGHFIVLSKADDNGNVYVNDPANKKKNGYYSISKIAKELKYDKSFYIISR